MEYGLDYVNNLLCDVHEGLSLPEENSESEFLKGHYLYYHYGCDGFDDRGWGCGYRTLMLMCSWVRKQKIEAKICASQIPPVPSISIIQKTLVQVGDKETDFINSKQWIGTVEAALVIDTLYDVPSKLIHILKGDQLTEYSQMIFDHFKSKGSPLMMGGDADNSSKGIVGICKGKKHVYLLVVDPHFGGVAKGRSRLQSSNWVKWQKLEDFHSTSFYNVCFPQLSPQQSNQV